MKKLAIMAAAAAFALSACGDTTDASEDAVADSVEVPADDAMTGLPDPVADADAMSADEEAAIEEDMDQAEATAEAAGDAAQDTVDDALAAAEAAQEEMEAAGE